MMADQEDILKMKKLEKEIGHVGENVKQDQELDYLEDQVVQDVNAKGVQIDADVMDVWMIKRVKIIKNE